ncbi:MAG: NAD kinase [Hyphomicrobiales bacterium]|nr:NAD kinase [Hyphomicrobiales bacterium]
MNIAAGPVASPSKLDGTSLRGAPRIAFVAADTEAARSAKGKLAGLYGDHGVEAADVVVALGGDGLMLQTLERLRGTAKPVYGMHRGSVGFLMNDYREAMLVERLAAAQRSIVHPLLMTVTTASGIERAHAINEVFVTRETYQAARLRISVDGKVRLDELIADGVLVATPAGSTAYNLSCNGPIIPLAAPLLALTPISPFRPRRWRGALLPDRAKFVIDVLEAEKRPVAAVADHIEIRDAQKVLIEMDRSIDLVMLHDPDHSLDERIIREQFGP